jgi:hypothetical protein
MPDQPSALKIWSDDEGRTLIVAETADEARELADGPDRSFYALPDDEQVRIRQDWPGVGEPLGPEWAKVSIEWAEGVSAHLGATFFNDTATTEIYTASAAVWCTHGRGFCATVED